MASVSFRKIVTDNIAAKILSLVIAAIFWVTVTIEKETVKSYSVPLRFANLPPGLIVDGTPPRTIDVTVTGPEILFLAHPVPWMPVTLNLLKTGKGTVDFPDLRGYIKVPQGVRVIRVFPSSLELKLVER